MKTELAPIAVIGGTGLNQLPGLKHVAEHSPDTPYGSCSHAVVEGSFDGQTVFFLPRHGTPHRIPPHQINYRANLWALSELGVRELIAVNAVGGIQEVMQPGDLVFPDQIIDYTWGREHTYSDGAGSELAHVDFTHPYDRDLRMLLVEAAAEVAGDTRYFSTGTYAATQGPRLESAAEIKRLRQDGCDLVGMTGMPEAGLARELNLAYACICMVVNPAAGLSETLITLEAMEGILRRNAAVISEILVAALRRRAQIQSATL